MQNQVWEQLTAAFPAQATEWRVVSVSQDKQQAQVRAQLYASAVTERLNKVVGLAGWSNSFTVMGDAVGCALTVNGVTKSSMLALLETVDGSTRAHDALVAAGALFGMRPHADGEQIHTVDYDAESRTILFEPELEADSLAALVPDSTEPLTPSSSAPPETPAAAPKPEGQVMIDRLVERLKEEGLGLEAAKFMVKFEGYGDSPEASRELYSKLRALLKGQGA